MDGVAQLRTQGVSTRGPSRVALVHMPLFESRRPSTQLGIAQTLLQQRGIVAHAHYLNLAFARRIGWALNDALCRGADAGALADGLLARELDGACRGALADFDARIVRLLRSEARAFVSECVERVAWHEYSTVTFASRPGQLRFAQALAHELERAWPHLRVSLDLGRALASILARQRAGRPLATRVTTRGPSFEDFFAEAARVELPAIVGGEAIVIPLGEAAALDANALADEARRVASRHPSVVVGIDDRVLPPAALPAFREALAGAPIAFEYVGAALLDRCALEHLRACGCRRLDRGRIGHDAHWLDQVAVAKWAHRLGLPVRWDAAAGELARLVHPPAPDRRFGPVHEAVLAACDAPVAESQLCAQLGAQLGVSADALALACEQLAASGVLLGDGRRWLALGQRTDAA